MIYAIRAGDFVKIGFTDGESVDGRLESMQTGCPLELVVVASGPGDRKLERKYHRWLKHAGCHERGEWFKAGPSVEGVIWRIRQSNQPKVLPKKVIAGEWPVFDSTRSRLGRAIEYAKQFAGEHRDSSTNLAGAAQALQPDKGSTPTREG